MQESTVAGGAEIGGIIAKELGWKLVDKTLIADISSQAKVPSNEGAIMDERVDPWLHRITRSLWGKSADGFSAPAPAEVFDADMAAALARNVIEEAYSIGHCVIIGRGSQCILRGKDDVFHSFVHARWEDRVHRVQMREMDCTDAVARINSVDQERVQYVRLHYGENQMDPHLYDLMVSSKRGTGATAGLILLALETMQ